VAVLFAIASTCIGQTIGTEAVHHEMPIGLGVTFLVTLSHAGDRVG
jgi:hypothetical protein